MFLSPFFPVLAIPKVEFEHVDDDEYAHEVEGVFEDLEIEPSLRHFFLVLFDDSLPYLGRPPRLGDVGFELGFSLLSLNRVAVLHLFILQRRGGRVLFVESGGAAAEVSDAGDVESGGPAAAELSGVGVVENGGPATAELSDAGDGNGFNGPTAIAKASEGCATEMLVVA